jgi:CubicO group peptidase (beta-lactamase class C family)
MSKSHRFIVLLPLFLTACGTLSDMHVDENPQDVKELACTGDINAMVNGVAEKYLHKEKASGLAIGIIRNDGVARTWGYGYTNAVNGYKIDGQTLFALGSVSKGVTGEDIQQLAYDFIFDSLKMGNTSFYGSKLKAYPYRAIGHAGDQPKFIRRGEVVPDWSFNKNMVAAASLYSNVDDLLKYLRAHIDDSQPGELSAAIQVTEKVYYPRQIEAANIAWVTDTKSNQKMTYQVGYIGGYSSYIGFDKKHKNAVVVLQNTFNWSNYIGHDLLLKMAMADDYQGKCPDRENAHN